jgi:hypothetical protein
VLSDDELEALHDIERRLGWDSPELAQQLTAWSRGQRRVAVSVHGPECSWLRSLLQVSLSWDHACLARRKSN